MGIGLALCHHSMLAAASEEASGKKVIAFGMANGCVGVVDQRCPEDSRDGRSLPYGRHDDPITGMSACPGDPTVGPSNQNGVPCEAAGPALADDAGCILVCVRV